MSALLIAFLVHTSAFTTPHTYFTPTRNYTLRGTFDVMKKIAGRDERRKAVLASLVGAEVHLISGKSRDGLIMMGASVPINLAVSYQSGYNLAVFDCQPTPTGMDS